MAKNSSLLSQLNVGDGMRWVHDVSALHGITPNETDFTIRFGDPSSAFTTTASLALPSNVAFKSDIQAVMKYAGPVSSSASLSSNSSLGAVYVATSTFTYTSAQASPGNAAEIGDMFVRNQNTTATGPYYDVIQTNIDANSYSLRSHTHSVTISGITSETTLQPAGTVTTTVTGKTTTFSGSFKPSGTVSTTVTGKTTTFSGSFTPAGSVTVGTFGFTSSDANVTHSLTINGAAHTHSFSGTPTTLTMTYDKPESTTKVTTLSVTGSITTTFTPGGTVAVTLTSQSANATITNAKFASHTHSINITDVTFTGSYTPSGEIAVTLTTSSETAALSGAKFASHSHSFNGGTTTFSGSFTPSGGISKPNVNVTLSSSTTTFSTGGVTLTSTSGKPSASMASNVIVGATYTTNSESLTFNLGTVGISVSNTQFLQTLNVALATSTFTNITGVTAALASAPTFTGTASTVTVSGKPLGTIGAKDGDVTGSISYIKTTGASAEFTGTASTVTVSGSVTGNTGAKDGGLTGTITYVKITGATAEFTGTEISPTITWSLSANHSHSIGTASATSKIGYTPAGTIGAASSTPSLGGSISVTYDKLESAVGKFTGTAGNVTVSGTPLLNAPVSTFTGTSSNVTVSGTPLLNAPVSTFTGTTFTHSHSFSTVAGTSQALQATNL